jgi:TPR repeat protein
MCGVFANRPSQGDVLAQYLLGSVFLIGQGVTQDYAESVKWLRRAADQGHSGAQFVLGGMYAVGRGVPLDLV